MDLHFNSAGMVFQSYSPAFAIHFFPSCGCAELVITVRCGLSVIDGL